MRNLRYCEILVAQRHLMSVQATVYNTVGLNDCPEEQWKAINADKLKKELGATTVVLNGPRYFVMDRNALRNPGGTRNLDGLEMREVAVLEVKNRKRTPYTENTVERQNQYVYEAGKYVYELLAPGGKSYIMQSYSQEVDPKLDEAALQNLGSRLKLPKGWQYRARKLDHELVVRNPGSQAYVVQDDFRDTYQKMQ